MTASVATNATHLPPLSRSLPPRTRQAATREGAAATKVATRRASEARRDGRDEGRDAAAAALAVAPAAAAPRRPRRARAPRRAAAPPRARRRRARAAAAARARAAAAAAPLPPPPHVLIFDLDHTLIHSGAECVDPDVPGFVITLAGHDTYVHVRPYALELLAYLLAPDSPAGLRVGFWTAGIAEYAHKVVEGLLGTLLGMADWRERIIALRSRASACAIPGGQYVKDVRVLMRALGTPHVLLVDDDPVHRTLPTNRGHVIPVPPFFADGAHRDAFLAVVLRRFERRGDARERDRDEGRDAQK